MNANEIADDLKKYFITEGYWESDLIEMAETMLRQLQTENEALKKTVDSLFAGLESSLALNKAQVERNNKPVAWFEQDPDMKSVWYQSDQDSPNAIPLYAHLVKELTDGEIVRISETCDLNHVLGLIEFARAILRKAQEK
jgi:hypothetical protein